MKQLSRIKFSVLLAVIFVMLSACGASDPKTDGQDENGGGSQISKDGQEDNNASEDAKSYELTDYTDEKGNTYVAYTTDEFYILLRDKIHGGSADEEKYYFQLVVECTHQVRKTENGDLIFNIKLLTPSEEVITDDYRGIYFDPVMCSEESDWFVSDNKVSAEYIEQAEKIFAEHDGPVIIRGQVMGCGTTSWSETAGESITCYDAEIEVTSVEPLE